MQPKCKVLRGGRYADELFSSQATRFFGQTSRRAQELTILLVCDLIGLFISSGDDHKISQNRVCLNVVVVKRNVFQKESKVSNVENNTDY